MWISIGFAEEGPVRFLECLQQGFVNQIIESQLCLWISQILSSILNKIFKKYLKNWFSPLSHIICGENRGIFIENVA